MMFLSGLITGLFISEFANVLFRNKKWSIWNETEFDKYQTIEKEKYLLFKIEQDKENSKK